MKVSDQFGNIGVYVIQQCCCKNNVLHNIGLTCTNYMFITGIFRTNHTLSSHVRRKLKFKLTQIQMLFSVHDNLAFIKELFIRSRISSVSENVRLIFVCTSLFINITAIEAGLLSFVLSFRAVQCLKLSKLRNDRNQFIPQAGSEYFHPA